MSNSTYDNVNATNDELMAFAGSTEGYAPKKSNVLYRLLALILAACPIVLLCLMPMRIIAPTASGYSSLEGSAIALFTALFTGNNLPDGYVIEKLFSVVPVYAHTGDVLFVIHNIALYAMAVVLAISAILALVALFSGKCAPGLARAIAWLNMWAVGGVMMSYFTICYLYELDYFLLTKATIVPLAITAGCMFFGFILSAIKAPKKVFVSTLFFLFTLLFNVVLIYLQKHFVVDFAMLGAQEGIVGMLFKYGQWVVLGFSGLALLISTGMVGAKKKFGGNLFVAILHIIVAVALVVAFVFNMDKAFSFRLTLANLEIPFNGFVAALIALGVCAFFELIIAIVRLAQASKEKKAPVEEKVEEFKFETEEKVEDTAAVKAAIADAIAEEDPQEAVVEEEKDYVEAVPYQPVVVEDEEEEEEEEEEAPVVAPAPIPVVEEIAPAAAPAPAVAPAPVEPTPAEPAPATNLKIDDEFIATLSDDERQQFADVFILKSAGEFPGVPDYKPGEDNSAFFRKIFVYLGKYRSRIPDDVMAKIYDYAVSK